MQNVLEASTHNVNSSVARVASLEEGQKWVWPGKGGGKKGVVRMREPERE